MTDSEHLTLTVLGGPQAGTKFVVETAVDNILIGSDPSCGFCLNLPGVSPIHARLWVDLTGATIYDTNSPKGLYINDDRVSGQAPLRNGDILWLGSPGDEDVVMIQCRIPPHAQAAAGAGPSVPAFVPPPMPAAAAPQPPSPPSDFDIVAPPAEEEQATLIVPATVEETPEAAPMLPETTPASIEEQATVILGSGAEPEPPGPQPRFPVDSTPMMPSVPQFFEDETVSDMPAPIPPPPPMAPAPTPIPRPAPPTRPVEPTPVPATARPLAPTPVPRAAPPKPRAATPAPKATAKPPAPAPKPAAPAPAPAPAEEGAGAPSAMGKYIGIAAAALIVLAGASYAVWQFVLNKPAAPPVTVAAVPTTQPEATLPPSTQAAEATPEAAPSAEPTAAAPAPTPEAAKPTPEPAKPTPSAKATPATPTPTPKPTPSAKPTPAGKATPPPATQGPSAEAARAQQVADLLGQGDGALTGRKYDAAVALYNEALRLDPGNARAADGKAKAAFGVASLRKSFVPGRTSVVGKSEGKSVSGFESEDVSVAKAPDYSGRIEFEANPAHVAAGDSYAVKVFLVNDGKRAFKIGSLVILTMVNGARSAGGPVGPPGSDIATQQRVLLQELPGVWQEGVKTWALDVQITSNRGDVFKNQLTWR